MLEAIKIYFFPCFITVFTVIYLQSKIINQKFEWNFLNCIALFLLMAFCLLNYMFVGSFIRFLTTTILLSFFSIFIFKIKLYKSFIVVFLEQLLLFISEFFYMFVFSLFSINLLEISQSNFIFLISINLVISLTAIFMYDLSFIKGPIQKILKMLDSLNKGYTYLVLLIFVVSLNFFLTSNYITKNNITILFINTIFIIIYSIIFIIFIREKNRNILYANENKLLLSSLNEYEKMLDYQRINNHENKNQLLVIKSMMEKNNKNVIEYINEIIKEKREDDEIIYNNAKRIPSGGLQGLIYQKMLLMKENNINSILNISKQVRKINFSDISPKMNYDICRIVGIIIDNAIEETSKIDEKNKEIMISMYNDEYFIIEVSNRFKSNIDLNNIYKKGYTTKGKNHGYGLSLLKKIVDNNSRISNEISITNNIFTQMIKIKM